VRTTACSSSKESTTPKGAETPRPAAPALLHGQQLAARGDKVTGLHRSPAQTGTVRAAHATPVSGDLIADSVGELTAEAADHETVVFSAGAHGTRDPHRDVDRLCVKESTTKEEVEKYVIDFLKDLVS